MAPSIDGVVHTFAEHGLYDGLFLMRDEETGTYWDHVTGEAVYGPQVGTALEVANLLHSRADQVLANNPDALIALSDRTLRTDEDMGVRSLLSRVGGRLSRMFSSTVKEEDDRLPTMDIGMGIWQPPPNLRIALSFAPTDSGNSYYSGLIPPLFESVEERRRTRL